jgi:hypothetical protein
MECPQKVERRVGILEKFCASRGSAHGFVRVGDDLLFVPMNTRGVLQKDGNIVLCSNGSRYVPIVIGADISIDVIVGPNGKPSAGLWAPKQRPQQ